MHRPTNSDRPLKNRLVFKVYMRKFNLPLSVIETMVKFEQIQKIDQIL